MLKQVKKEKAARLFLNRKSCDLKLKPSPLPSSLLTGHTLAITRFSDAFESPQGLKGDLWPWPLFPGRNDPLRPLLWRSQPDWKPSWTRGHRRSSWRLQCVTFCFPNPLIRNGSTHSKTSMLSSLDLVMMQPWPVWFPPRIKYAGASSLVWARRVLASS